MAEKKDKKESAASEGLHIFEIVCLILILFYFLHLVGQFIAKHFSSSIGLPSGSSPGFFTIIGQVFGNLFASTFPTIELLSIFFSVVFIMGIIYTSFRLYYLKKIEESHQIKEARARQEGVGGAKIKNPKWQRVLEHANSSNPSDWRLSILEADILLGDVLEKMGYHGEGIGEMLKSVEKSDFNTIDNAWEAHKVRNAIAHEGSDFLLSQRETQRVIGLYESVFQEFKFV